jgi:hypothetical protein
MADLLRKPIPIYSTSGDWCALLVYPHIYSSAGEWIGWITPDKSVFDVQGVYVGWLTNEPRILRHRLREDDLDRREPPPQPGRVRPPASVPLPPMMAELPYEILDVFEEEGDLLHTIDHGEFKEDMD